MAHLNLQAWPQAAMPTTPQVRVQFFAQHAMAEQAARDLALTKDRQTSIENRVERIENWMDEQAAWTEQTVQFHWARKAAGTQLEKLVKDLADRQASIESRMESVEAQADQLTAMLQQAASIESRLESVEKLTKEAMGRIESIEEMATTRTETLKKALEETAWDLAAKTGQIEKLVNEHIASTSRHVSEQSSRHAIQQNSLESFEKLATELIAANDRQDSFENVENRMESIEKLVNEHIASTSRHVSVQSSRHTMIQNSLESVEKLVTELIAGNDLQGSLENRIDWCERQLDSENHDRQHMFARIAEVEHVIERHENDLHGVECVIEHHEHDLHSASQWSRSLETRMESIEKLMKEQEHIAATSLDMESIEKEKLTKEISAELHVLQTAGGQELRALVSANDRQASLERRESIEKLNDQQIAAQLQELQTARAASDLILANDRHASRDVEHDWEQVEQVDVEHDW